MYRLPTLAKRCEKRNDYTRAWTTRRLQLYPHPLFNVGEESLSMHLCIIRRVTSTLKRGVWGYGRHFDFNLLLPSNSAVLLLFYIANSNSNGASNLLWKRRPPHRRGIWMLAKVLDTPNGQGASVLLLLCEKWPCDIVLLREKWIRSIARLTTQSAVWSNKWFFQCASSKL